MRMAYADSPYLGCCSLYDHEHGNPETAIQGCWDDLNTHKALIAHLVNEYPDGWALSASSPSLRHILPLCPDDVRVGVWAKSFCAFKRGVRPAYAWEPVIYRSEANPPHRKHAPPPKGGKQNTPKDFVVCPITLKKGLTGAKPPAFCEWVIDLLNLTEGDELCDLFPGTGSMGLAAVARRLRVEGVEWT